MRNIFSKEVTMMHNMRKLNLAAIFIFCSSLFFALIAGNLYPEVKNKFDDKNLSTTELNKDIDELLRSQSERNHLFTALRGVLLGSNKPEHRRMILEKMCLSLKTESSAVKSIILGGILESGGSDLSAVARGNLRNYLNRNESFENFKKEDYLLLGIVADNGDVVKLKTVVAQEDEESKSKMWLHTKKWYASLALAKNGDAESLKFVAKQIRNEDDALTLCTKVFSDLVYIRQNVSLELLNESLDSEENLPTTKATATPIKVSSWAAYHLSMLLDNFPVKKDYPGWYTVEDIQTCRAWMKNRSNWSF